MALYMPLELYDAIVAELADDAGVGVLKSTEWFEWDAETKTLQTGASFVSRVKSEVTRRNKT